MLGKFPQDDEGVAYILEEIEAESFLPKQLTASNGVIPNQVHARNAGNFKACRALFAIFAGKR